MNDIIYSVNGSLSDKLEGWEFIPSENVGGMTYNEAEGYYPDKGGKLLGPQVVGANEHEFYALTFSASASADCHWGVFFYDCNGDAIVSDVYSSVYAGEKVKYEQIVYGREGSTSLRPFFQSCNGVEVWDLEIRKVSPDYVADWNDSLYKTLPPLESLSGRMENLSATINAISTGAPWRVVMLGDSIVNDAFNSNFQASIKRAYSASELKFICSVRGSTGCWHYQEPEHFKAYVADLKPDLLIIGGISQRDDIDAIRKVIEMARKQLSCEILLLSGPLDEDWREHNPNNPELDLPEQSWPGNPFVTQQRKLADEMDIDFVDMASIWHGYLGRSGKPWQWFYRDKVHGNDRGKQIVGRILSQYFF